MLTTHEIVTAGMFIAQAFGTIWAIIYGIIRIERRFTRLETNMEWIKKQCPRCNDK